MYLNLDGFELDPQGSQRLRELLSNSSSPAADALISHLIDLGAKYAIVEDPYIDKDYSSDYQAFYSSAFKDYERTTRRAHIFASDVREKFGADLAKLLEGEDVDESYLGYIVIRPLEQGPIGRTVLKFPKSTDTLRVRPMVRAPFNLHLFGRGFCVNGAPFIQQDHRISACAQAALWIADRVLHVRHQHTGWHSMAEITNLATTPTDAELTYELPAGSMGLSPLHVIRALKGLGHQPLGYYLGDKSKPEKDTAEQAIAPSLPAAEVVFRYLDSGLPVILGVITPDMAHAITAVGYVESTAGQCRPGTTYDSFVRAFIVHDDQRGPYRYMPLTKADVDFLPRDRLLIDNGKVLVVDEVISHIFVPLPSRVLIRAEKAEVMAHDHLVRQASAASEGLIAEIESEEAKGKVRDFHQRVTNKLLLRRTYLTSAGRYRHHLAKSGQQVEIGSTMITRVLPHFVWVTEFLDPESALHPEHHYRPIIGHAVVNATSTGGPNSDLLMIHSPHVLVERDINSKDPKKREQASVFEEDGPYAGRVRLESKLRAR
ncbi:hypothetical protein [Dongia sp.]|uniref:hypothetical protein n=1 Tax=Dongia sp. TaxID=1977262 RepID=UPI003752376F